MSCNCDKNGCGSEFTEDEMKKVDEIKKVMEKYKETKGALIQVLHEAQEIYGYLPLKIQKVIAEGMNVSVSEIYGIVTFYTQFITEPKGKNKIQVCLGTACYVKGAQQVIDKLKELLKIDVGQVTPDGKFSLDTTRCLGACSLAPVMTINGEVHGKLTPDMIEGILAQYN